MTAPVRSLRIFIVEDHPDTLRYLKMYLEFRGYSVDAATNVREALVALPSTSCDVLLTDIGLPDGDGWELMRRLDGTGPAFAIAMSGFGRHIDHVRSREAGFRYHLTKPFPPEELDAILEEACGEHRNRQREQNGETRQHHLEQT